jgi:hypothetical protein
LCFMQHVSFWRSWSWGEIYEVFLEVHIGLLHSYSRRSWVEWIFGTRWNGVHQMGWIWVASIAVCICLLLDLWKSMEWGSWDGFDLNSIRAAFVCVWIFGNQWNGVHEMGLIWTESTVHLSVFGSLEISEMGLIKWVWAEQYPKLYLTVFGSLEMGFSWDGFDLNSIHAAFVCFWIFGNQWNGDWSNGFDLYSTCFVHMHASTLRYMGIYIHKYIVQCTYTLVRLSLLKL